MCDKLVREYRIWLQDVLEILHELYEDVVPAGRLDEGAYWKTKALYRDRSCKEQKDFISELLQYAAEGRKTLKAVQEKLASKEDRTEEKDIRLRRENAAAVLNSLQFLANFTWLAGQYVDIYGEFGRYFEVDVADEVKHIRSGVVVKHKAQVAKTYPFCTSKSGKWKHFVAG